MTIKQVLIGTILGATAFVSLLHRLPKQPVPHSKITAKQAAKAGHVARRPSKKPVTLARLSLSKTYE
jgi:hypothetical protein